MQKCQNETKAVLKLFLLTSSTSKVFFKCQEKIVAIYFLKILCLIAWQTQPNWFLANPIFGLSWVT